MRTLKLAIVFAAAAFAGVNPAFATDVDVSTVVQSQPASASLSTTSQTTYVSYRITLTPYTATSGEVFEPVYFTATTSVGGAAEVSAPFRSSSLPVGCVLAPDTTTTINCTFTPGLRAASTVGNPPPAASAPKVFTVVVQTPTLGTSISLVSETRWYESVSDHGCSGAPVSPFPFSETSPPCYETEGSKTTTTALTSANPLVVDTYVPTAGGAVTAGSDTSQGPAMCVAGKKWVTIVKVPEAAQVGIDLSPFIDPSLPLQNPQFFSTIGIPNLADPLLAPKFFGVGTRWYEPGAANKLVVNTLRRDVCTVTGSTPLQKAAQILKEKIYYKPDGGTFQQVLLCAVTSGPDPGRPCIFFAQVYTQWTLPRNVPPAIANQYLGDHEWVIFANENGKYATD